MEASSTTPATGAGAGAGFTITRQDHQPTFDPTDPGGSVWTVYFRTTSGVDSSVTVPDAQYNAEHVGQLIAERVQTIEAVAQLGGEN